MKKKYVTPLFNPKYSENVYVTPFYVTAESIFKSLCNRFYVTPGLHKKYGGLHNKKKTYGRDPPLLARLVFAGSFFF